MEKKIKRTPPKKSTSSRTLVYFKNGIGNFILMTPALRALAKMDHTKKIVLCTDSNWNDSRTQALNDIWDATPWIEKVIRYPKETYRDKPERVFYSKHSEGGDAFAWFQSISPNIGNQISWTSSLIHESDYYMIIVRRDLGYRGQTPDQFIPVGNLPNDIPQEYVTICNGSFGRMKTQKQWPNFASLVKIIHTTFNLPVVSVGNGNELSEVQHIVDRHYVDKLSILESAAVINKSKLFITTDTGLMHVADALKRPMIVMFGGSIVSKNGPINKNNIIARSGVSCQPCQYTAKFDTCDDPVCMKYLSVGDVVSYARNYLQ